MLMVERQDPDNFTRFQTRERCTLEIAAYVFKRELVDTNAFKLQPSSSEKLIVDGHCCHTALHFAVKAKENQDKVPKLYW